jgi:integrase
MELSLFPSSEGVTARQIVNVYLKHIAGRTRTGDLTESVREGYERDLTSYLELFGDRLVRDLRQHDLTQWLAAHPGWKSVNTKRRCIAAVLACFRWAREEELIPNCPYTSPRALRGLVAETRRPATPEEFQLLVQFGSRPLKWALFFLYQTGCRTCEMRELTWENVRLTGSPHLYLVKHKTARRTGRPRIIGLNVFAVRLLKALKRRSKSEWVFTNCDGQPWTKNSFCLHFRRHAARLGLNQNVDRVTAYCLRHTYACDGLRGGETANAVARQLGHTTSAMVERIYARSLGQDVVTQNDVAARISRRRKKA